MRAELVTTLKRKATELIAEVEREKKAILITHRGLPAAYLVDTETFELQQRRIEILEAIARGERDISNGKTMSHDDVKQRFSKWRG